MTRDVRPPEVREDPDLFRFVNGAWMRINDLGEYNSAGLAPPRRPVHLHRKEE